jgi:hypothetical protein
MITFEADGVVTSLDLAYVHIECQEGHTYPQAGYKVTFKLEAARCPDDVRPGDEVHVSKLPGSQPTAVRR